MLDPLKFVLADIVPILMMSKKLAALGLPETKIFQNKGYDVIISVHDVNNKILSRDLNCIADRVMWRKFGDFCISMWEVIITSIF